MAPLISSYPSGVRYAPIILGESELSPRRLSYWRALATKVRASCDVVDPDRRSLKSLRDAGISGRVYRAAGRGKWGKSSSIITL